MALKVFTKFEHVLFCCGMEKDIVDIQLLDGDVDLLLKIRPVDWPVCEWIQK